MKKQSERREAGRSSRSYRYTTNLFLAGFINILETHLMKAGFLAFCAAAVFLLSGGPARADIIFSDDFESYTIADPADLSPNWVHNGLGTAPNASRIFHTNNFGGSDLWIANAANAAAGTGINSTATITLAPTKQYLFSAALVTETFNGARTATGTYDLLVGTTSLIGGPQPFTARGDDLNGGGASYNDQLTSHVFNSGAGGNLTIKIAFNGTDASNPFVGIDDVSISDSLPFVLEINRNTGGMTFRNPNTTALNNIIGYKITSALGGLTQSGWDKQSTGTNLTSDNDQWTTLSNASSVNDLSEAVLSTTGDGNGGNLAANGSWSFGNVWRKSPFEDVDFELLLDDGTILTDTADPVPDFTISYIGNGGEPFSIGDFNYDGTVNSGDWVLFKSKYRSANLAAVGTTAAHQAELYNLGDINADGVYTLADFIAFETAYDAVNGAGAFAAITIPEPTTTTILLLCGTTLMLARRRKINRQLGQYMVLSVIAAGTFLGALPSASAQLPKLDSNSFTNKYNGNQIWDGTAFQNQWSQAGGATTAALSLNGSALVVDNALSGLPAGNNGWIQQDNGSSPAEALTGSYTLEVRGKLNNTTTAADGFVLWAELGNNTSQIWIKGDSVAKYSSTTGTTLLSGVDNTDGFHTFRLTYDAADTTAGAEGTYHVWRDGLNITGNGISRNSAAGTNKRLIVGDCCTNIGNPVDPFEIEYVRFQEGAFQPQFIAELKLRVNTTTGNVSIVNDGSPINFDLNSYSITSGNSLSTAGWNSLQDQVIGGDPTPGNKDDGNSWEEFDNTGSSFIGEGFLTGSTTVLGGSPLALGNIFTPSGAQDLVFTYTATNTGNLGSGVMTGVVEYVSGGQPGDFDGDGDVDGRDFLKWQRGGSPSPLSAGDLADWKNNYGVGQLAASTAVPEPSSLALIAAAIGMALSTRNRQRRPSTMAVRTPRGFFVPTTALVIATSFATAAMAAVTNDRDFRFGEGAGENGSAGAIVGSGHSIPNAGDTLDEVGPTGAYLDLFESGSPVYLDVAAGPKARPGAGAGALGVQFDGVDDVLSGTPLNRPDELATRVLPAVYPLNYTGILEHGLQGWVYPDQAGLSKGTFQAIVTDTVFSGGPAINAAGQWTQINSQHASGADGIASVPGSVPVVGNQWYHVMHHHYPLSGDNFLSVLYVNGTAVSANNDSIPLGGLTNYADVLAVGAAEIAGDGTTPVFGNFFQGAIDNLEMYIAGDNTAQGGQNWGTFDLFADNDWIANRIATTVPGGVLKPGDVNRDGVVSTNDVTAFIAGWQSSKVLQGAHVAATVGDWETWGWGDMNHDGIVDLSDAFILHEGLEAVGLSLDFGLLSAQVPEPSTGTMLVMGVAASAALGRRRGR